MAQQLLMLLDMAKHEKTWSFKEVDEACGSVKGTAFRAFKQLEAGFDEGCDYYFLHYDQDLKEIQQLRSCGRIYPSTVSAVLLKESGYTAVLDYLEH